MRIYAERFTVVFMGLLSFFLFFQSANPVVSEDSKVQNV